jgi:hypothetical protein
MLPFYLRHYSEFADEIIIYDDGSNDGSRELMEKCSKCKLLEWPFDPGLNDEAMLTLWYHAMHEARQDGIDWLIVPDIDEFIWSRNILSVLAAADSMDYEVLSVIGFDMIGDGQNGLPKDDGRQIWEQCQLGIYQPVYGKPIVVKPFSDIKWCPGRHGKLDGSPTPRNSCHLQMLKLLHYRFMGPSYTHDRNQKNHSRVAVARKVPFGGHADTDGYGTPQYAHGIIPEAINALEFPFYNWYVKRI